jgi:hypothetical protein
VQHAAVPVTRLDKPGAYLSTSGSCKGGLAAFPSVPVRSFHAGPILLLHTNDIQVEVEGKLVETQRKLGKRLKPAAFGSSVQRLE